MTRVRFRMDRNPDRELQQRAMDLEAAVNGSRIEIVHGTTPTHGGPCTDTCGHRMVNMDEIELMDEGVFREAGKLPAISRKSLPLPRPARKS